MFKSLVFVTTICSLNVNSFNIQPKNVTWRQEQTTQEGTYTSNKTLNHNAVLVEDNERDITIQNINTYKNENNYITTETTIITEYFFYINLDANNENVENSLPINLTIYKSYYTSYKGFSNNNVNLDNLYIYQEDYANFSDNKGTSYNYTINNIGYQTYNRYNATNETKAAITQIKNATTYDQLRQAEANFNTAYNNTTNSNWVDSITTTVNNKKITSQANHEQLELGNEITTIQKIGINTTITLTYNNELLNTDALLNNWYQSYFEIIDGNNIWNYKATSTDQATIENTYYLTIDTHGAQPNEPIDIGGLMWDIIGMPFSFINQAFNVTLFPGTIYEFNIGTLFKGAIAILAVLFVVKLFTKGIDVLGEYTGSMSAAKDRRSNRAWTQEQREMQRENHQMAKEEHNKRMNE